ncbi:MAG: TIR domain-containing protein [Firmicutes bacterium]|nr:TIR domain-containing protein [Bacillota bacterium]
MKTIEAYNGEHPYNFICYAHADSDKIFPILEKLKERGCRFWFDGGIHSGSRWSDVIAEKLSGCKTFIIFLSENSLKSQFCMDELGMAKSEYASGKMGLIPISIDDAEITGGAKLHLNATQITFKSRFKDEDAFIDHLVRELSASTFEVVDKPAEAIITPKLEMSKEELLNAVIELSEGFNTKMDAVAMRTTKDGEFQRMKSLMDKLEFPKIQEQYTRLVSIFSPDIGPGKNIFEELVKNFRDNGYLLELNGPYGTGKYRFMQCLYLTLFKEYRAGKSKLFPIFYDFTTLEKLNRAELENRIDKDVDLIHQVVAKNQLTPIFLFFGLSEFASHSSIEQVSADQLFAKKLSLVENSPRVVAIDSSTVSKIGRSRDRKNIPLADGRPDRRLNFYPVDLVDTDKVSDLKGILIELGEDGQELAKLFKYFDERLFYSIDLFLIRVFQNIANKGDLNLYDIHYWVENILVNDYKLCEDEINEIAEITYAYNYTNEKFRDDETTTKALYLLKRHSFFNDFFLATAYVNRVKNFQEDGDVSFFEIILPKHVIRFVISKFAQSNNDEEIVLKFITENYGRFSYEGRCGAFLCLSSMRSPSGSAVARKFLRNYYTSLTAEVKEKLQKNLYSDKQEYKEDLLCLRLLSMAFIVQGEQKILHEFLDTLMTNDIANEVNRAFLLSFLGDKKNYVPGLEAMDLTPNYEIGENIFKIFCKSLESSLMVNLPSPLIEADLFTLCSMAQARIAGKLVQCKFDIKGYIKRVITYIDKFLQTREEDIEFEKFNLYLSAVKQDFEKFLKGEDIPIEASFVNKFSESAQVKRTKWVEAGIPDPESIGEHTIGLMLICLLYIPQTGNWGHHDKDKVLKMLLIHDLAAVELGNMQKLGKNAKKGFDAEYEDKLMKQLMLRGTYPSLSNLDEYYKLWEEYNEQKTADSRLVSDIATIQTVFQFYKYLGLHPDKFNSGAKAEWNQRQYGLKTDLGRDLYRRLVIDNFDTSEE